uniref:Uncharacterized protein n=1 Tax=mine drainage metagenome TaxID=410659 RepID=E6PHK5_9ZZZZ
MSEPRASSEERSLAGVREKRPSIRWLRHLLGMTMAQPTRDDRSVLLGMTVARLCRRNIARIAS